MKLVHITDTYAPIGGLEKYVIEIAEGLSAHGVSNAIIYRNESPQTPPSKGIRYYCIGNHVEGWNQIEKISGILETEAPDVICLHDVPSPKLIQELGDTWPVMAYVQNFVPVCPGLAKYYRRSGKICTRAFGMGCVTSIYINRCASARHPLNVARIMRQTGAYLDAYKGIANIVVASHYMHSLMVQNGFRENQLHVYFAMRTI